MIKPYVNDIETLHSLFETNFMDAYREANVRKRRSILPFLQTIYRRWLFSALIENTPISPANLLESICDYHNEPSALYPVARPKGKAKLSGISIEFVAYELENHPVVADLKLLADYCTPHVDLLETDIFTTNAAIELGEKLSLNDPHYAAYLLEVAIWIGMIAKVPSVGVNRFKPTQQLAEILAAPAKDIFHDVVEITIALAAKGLQNLVMLPESIFSQPFIKTILTAPMSTDDIFSRIYDVLGYDMEDLLDITETMENEDSLDMDILAGTFMAGVFLDKFFFTPFGHFLKLIRPLYFLPFEFPGEIADYVNVCDDPEEGSIAFFAPCSSYTLTRLGHEYFGLEKTEQSYFNAAEVLPFAQLKDTVFSSQEALSVFVTVGKHVSSWQQQGEVEEIATFRVRRADDPSVWIHLQMPITDNLHDMYEEITEALDIKDNNDYTFYHDKQENRFAEYTSQKRSKGGKKTSDTVLDDLDFDHQKHLLLVAYSQAVPFGDNASTTRLNIELLHKKPPEDGLAYPRVSRVSKGFRDNVFM